MRQIWTYRADCEQCHLEAIVKELGTSRVEQCDLEMSVKELIDSLTQCDEIGNLVLLVINVKGRNF